MQNILSKLLRAQFRMAEETMRKPKPKLKEETIFERKEAKRLANVNTWSIDHTNEKIPEWMDPKTIRAIGLYFENSSNSHPLSKPIDPAIQKELIAEMQEAQHLSYFRFRNNQLSIRQYRQAMYESNIMNELQTLSNKLLTEFKQTENEPDYIPSYLQDEVQYYEQYQAILPEQQFLRVACMARLAKAYEGATEGGEGGDQDGDSGASSADDE